MARTRTKHHIGGFRVIAPIGVGASATVYRALNEATGAEVAVKVLAENFSLLPEMRQRFLDEVELLRAIDSPTVAKIYELGETESGQPYMVLELADRGDLRHRLEDLRVEGRAPGRADLLALAEHLAEALSALHRADIIHRDVSPGNVLIRTGGLDSKAARLSGPARLAAAKSVAPGAGEGLGPAAVLEQGERYLLADLGFAKDLEYASGLTAGGGTRGFAAPEQRDEVTVVDHRADVFSATAVMEWMAQGSGLVEDLELFLESGLATDPDRRFDSMDDWLAAAKRSLGVEPGQPTGESVASPERAQRSKPLLVSVGLVVLLGMAAAAFGLRPSPLDDDAGEQAVAAPSADVDGNTSDDGTSDSGTSDDGTVNEGASSRGGSDGAATDPGADSSDSEAGPGAEPEPDGSSDGPTVSSASTTTVADTDPSTAGSDGSPTTVASTTVPGSTTASTSIRPTSTPSTTAPPRTVPSSTVTTQALTTTTFDPVFAESPRAYVRTPVDESIISGDLRITGTAEYRGGVIGVNLVIRSIDSGLIWHDSTKSFRSDWIRFPLPVAPTNATEVTWSYTIGAEDLAPGRYLVRVWATGTDANDPVSNQHHVTITG